MYELYAIIKYIDFKVDPFSNINLYYSLNIELSKIFKREKEGSTFIVLYVGGNFWKSFFIIIIYLPSFYVYF